ncbi:hypothetical protein [Puniceibacterium sediminis]|nr:hypothetical protein [Puniceibacterium sediminis]
MEFTKEMTRSLEKTVSDLQAAANAAPTLDVAVAAISATFTVGPEGGHLQGWITYLDGALGKIHFKSTKVTHHSGLFAGAFAFPTVPIAKPDAILGKPGRTKVDGSWSTGIVTLYAGSSLIGAFPIAGTGAFGWSFEAVVEFTKG